MEKDLPGQRMGGGRYELVALLGQGGMGRVYRAFQREVGREVVIKVIHPHLVAHPGVLERLRREMQLTAKVEHRNTVRLYDFIEEDGQPALVMEYLRGETLRHVLHTQGPMPARRVAELGVQMARGLWAIHSAGVVHRDLKPENVMVVQTETDAEHIKILDFGVARPLAADSGITQVGALIGTPLYMSPEQAAMRATDARSDLYTLGVVLYEMATGAPPFAGDTPALLSAHVHNEPLPVRFVGGDVPLLRASIMRLLAKAPLERLQTAADVVRELEGFLSTSTTQGNGAITDTFVPSWPLPPAPRRRRWMLAVGLAVTVALAGATAVFLSRRPHAVSAEAVPAEAIAENDRGKELQRQGDLDAADAAYRRALVLAPHLQAASFNLALVMLRRGDATSALGLLDQIAKESPDHPSVLRVRAEAHRQLGDQPRALKDLEEHVRRHPNDSDGWLHLGRARLVTHADGAEDAFCRASRLGNAEAVKLCP